jgi:hypothetical protein
VREHTLIVRVLTDTDDDITAVLRAMNAEADSELKAGRVPMQLTTATRELTVTEVRQYGRRR